MMEIREASARDRDAILALRRRAFPDEDREKQEPAFWDWEFAGGRMFIAEENGRVVGHLGFTPRRFLVGGREVPALLAVDAMVDPGARRQGTFTRVSQFAAASLRGAVPLLVAWQIRPAVLEGVLRANWKSILFASVLLRPTPASIPLPVRRSPPPTVQEVIDASRFDQSPLWRYERRENGEAHLVIRDSVLKGIGTRCLVELGGEPRALRALVHDTLKDAARRGVWLAAALVSRDHPHYATLRRCGFFPGPHRFRLLAQSFDPLVSLEQRWALTWASTDHV
jgi:hypothetical protein